MSGPTSPAEYGEGMNDEELAEDGWAVGLDVWGPVEKAYSNFVSDMTLANSQLWSLQCAIEARERDHATAEGYAVAVAVLRGVAERTGSPAAQWCADYLEADPDRQAPRGAKDRERSQ